MHLTYDRISKHPVSFLRISGLSIEASNKLVTKLWPSFDQLEAQKLCHGRLSPSTYARR
jgi:hypothetical protein